MLKYFYDVNPYVEEQERYKCDSVVLELDEGTLKLTLKAVDAYNNVISGVPALVDETYTDLGVAIQAYNEVEHQLSQGDIVRAIPGARQLRESYNDNSRY